MAIISDRFAAVMLAILVSIDQVAQTLLVAPFALIGLANIPDPDETISGLLGRHSSSRWAILPSVLIDALFLILTLGRERDHCFRAAAREATRREI